MKLKDLIYSLGIAKKKTFKKKSKHEEYFLKRVFVGSLFFLLSVFFLIVALPLGILFLIMNFLFFFVLFLNKKRTEFFLRMRKDLKESPTFDEKVHFFFTDINFETKENVMILTEKRIVFLHIPKFGYDNVISVRDQKALKRNLNFDELKNKVEHELGSMSFREFLKKYDGYAMDYAGISNVKMNEQKSLVSFYYRGHKVDYKIKKEAFDDFRQHFSHYVK